MGHEAFVFDYLTLAGEKVAKRVANVYVKTVQKCLVHLDVPTMLECLSASVPKNHQYI